MQESANQMFTTFQALEHWSASPIERMHRLGDMLHRRKIVLESCKHVDGAPVEPYRAKLHASYERGSNESLELLARWASAMFESIEEWQIPAAVKLVAEELGRIHIDDKHLTLEGTHDGKDRMSDLLTRLGEAKASTDKSIKQEFVRYLGRELFPNLTMDLTFLQGLSMFLGYVDIQPGCKIPCNIEYLTTDPDLRRSHLPRSFELMRTIRQMAVSARQDLYPGAKIQVWRGGQQGASPCFILQFTGTTSVTNMDKRWYAKAVATGAVANADPRGIGKTAHEHARDQVIETLVELGCNPSSLVWITGHSLGHALAHREFLDLRVEGYHNTRLVGFNGPGLDTETMREAAEKLSLPDLARHMMSVSSAKDLIPLTGLEPAPGLHYAYSYDDTDQRQRGIIPSYFDDRFLEHGHPGLVWLEICGGRWNGDSGASLHHQIFKPGVLRRLLDWGRPFTAPLIFKPHPVEKGADPDEFSRK